MTRLKQTVIFVIKGKFKNFKTVQTHLQQNYNVVVVETDDLSSCVVGPEIDLINNSHDGEQQKRKNCDLLIISVAAEEDITLNEATLMKQFLDQGKSILCLGTSCCTSSNRTSTSRRAASRIVNEEFLSQYGMQFANDTVLRTVCSSKYLHPKHALISNGILHPSLIYHSETEKADHCHTSARGHKEKYVNTIPTGTSTTTVKTSQQNDDGQLFIYPFGCSLDVVSPAWPILSSGSLSFPLKRPLCGVWEDFSKPNNRGNDESSEGKKSKQRRRGRLMVIGSIEMFTDEWVEKELNLHLFETFVQFLLYDEKISLSRAEMTSKGKNIEDARTVPDIEGLSERVKWCLQEHKPLPQDLSLLRRRNIPSFDSSKIPMIAKLYDELQIKNEPLSLIRPDFEVPCPPLHPAVFQPRMLELSSPPLDLFDLDDEFAEPKVRLAQLTNKCTSEESMSSSSFGSSGTSPRYDHHDDEDLEYYVQEAGLISGLLVGEQEEYMGGKAVLRKSYSILFQSAT